MNKRDWMKWLGFGAFAAPIGFLKPAQAYETDWRDDILTHELNIHVYDVRNKDRSDFIHVYRWKDSIRVQHGSWKFENKNGSPFYISKNSIDKITEHKTIEEAYEYAKYLKKKYYD